MADPYTFSTYFSTNISKTPFLNKQNKKISKTAILFSPLLIRGRLSTPLRKSPQLSEQEETDYYNDDEDDGDDGHDDGSGDRDDQDEVDDRILTVTSLQGDRLESLEKPRLHFLNSFWGERYY